MSDQFNAQSANANSTTAPNPATNDNHSNPTAITTPTPPPNNPIALHTDSDSSAPANLTPPMSQNVSQCPTLHSFFLIQTPKPTSASSLPDPADLPDYQPAQSPKDGQPLSPIQQQAIHLLLQGLSDSAVARRLGVNRKTIHRWKWQTPLFYHTLDEAQRQAWGEGYGLLRASILTSAQTLNHLLKKGKPQQALQAARLLLSNTVLTRLER